MIQFPTHRLPSLDPKANMADSVGDISDGSLGLTAMTPVLSAIWLISYPNFHSRDAARDDWPMLAMI